MSISDWPPSERPREKLLTSGAMTLSNAELLAIFLRTGIRGQTAVDLGRQLLKKFGGLRQIAEADSQQFCQINGLGPAKYVQLQAALEIARRYLQESLQRDNVLTNSQDTRNYLAACLRGHQCEVFACLFLDNLNRVICFNELFYGTIDSATIYPREVVKRALTYNAAAVVLAHNHPSGMAEPSDADCHITQQLKQILNLIDVRVLDHFIIGDNQVTSLAERVLV